MNDNFTSKELDMNALEGVNGGVKVNSDGVFPLILQHCVGCGDRSVECWAYLEELKPKFAEGGEVEVACPKGKEIL